MLLKVRYLIKPFLLHTSNVNRCPKCSDYDGAVESPGVINEKGASLMAAYSNIDSNLMFHLHVILYVVHL